MLGSSAAKSEERDSPLLDVGARTLGDSDTGLGGVDPHGTLLLVLLALGHDLLEVDHELLRVVLGVREQLGRVQRENVVRNLIGALAQATPGQLAASL